VFGNGRLQLYLGERYTRFDFAGGELIAVFRPEDGMAIPVRVVCERLGLDLNTQRRRLRKHLAIDGLDRLLGGDTKERNTSQDKDKRESQGEAGREDKK
jgi:hypothetical protein